MTIQELYCDKRFENVVYFLGEYGFSSVDDLQRFDFDELLFIPGVSEEIIEEAKHLFSQHVTEVFLEMPTAQDADNTATHLAQSEIGTAVDTDNAGALPSNTMNEITQCIDALYMLFQKVNDLESVIALKEHVGTTCFEETVDTDVLIDLCNSLEAHISHEHIQISTPAVYSAEEAYLLRAVSVEMVFTEVNRGSAMIRYCNENGMHNLWDLRDFDFSHEKIKGIGPDTAAACKKA